MRLTLVGIAALVLPACSDYKDALVVNPCRLPIVVRFGSDQTVDDPAWATVKFPARIPPMTTRFVQSAFADVGPDEYSVLSEVNGTRSLIRVADVGETILVPVPDSVC